MKARIDDKFIDDFVASRDRALRAVLENDDLSLMKEYIGKYCPDVQRNLIRWNTEAPERIPNVLRLMAYKIIPEITTFTPEERNKARAWLREHNSKPMSWE